MDSLLFYTMNETLSHKEQKTVRFPYLLLPLSLL